MAVINTSRAPTPPSRIQRLTVPRAPSVASRTRPGTVPAKTTHPIRRPAPKPAPRVPVGKPGRTVTVQPVIPKFTPGALDPQAQSALGDAVARLRALTGMDPDKNVIPGAIGSLDFDRNEAYRRIAADTLQTTLDRDNGLEENDNNAAGRGIFNSGIRLDERAKTTAAAQRIFDQLTRDRTTADDMYKSGWDQAWSDYTRAKTDAEAGSNDRAYQNWIANQAPPGPAKTYKVFTKAQWLAYHRNAKTKLPTNPAELQKRYDAYVAAHSRG